jgi:CheY-like chemotaxis protein
MKSAVLIVEDASDKFADVASVVLNFFGPNEVEICRAATVVEAEELSASRKWKLLLLDISMDIVASKSGRSQNGHASTGGMAVLERMYLLGNEVPTIIVTAFDAFRESSAHREDEGMLGLEDINLKAKQILHNKYLGSVRYGADEWENTLREMLATV